MERIEVVQNDTPSFEFELSDAEGKIIDLSLVSVILFKMARIGEEDGKVTKPCVISNVPGTDGKCYVTLDASDTADDGEYMAEVELRYTGGVVYTISQFQIGIVNEVAEPKLDPPEIAPLVSPNVTGDYTVQWSTVDGATNYVLEEDDGTGWTEVYNGGNTNFPVTGKTDGSYFYRAKAQATYYTDSDWSDIEAVTVDIP